MCWPDSTLVAVALPSQLATPKIEQLRNNPRTTDVLVRVVSVVDGADRAEHATVTFLQEPGNVPVIAGGY